MILQLCEYNSFYNFFITMRLCYVLFNDFYITFGRPIEYRRPMFLSPLVGWLVSWLVTRKV